MVVRVPSYVRQQVVPHRNPNRTTRENETRGAFDTALPATDVRILGDRAHRALIDGVLDAIGGGSLDGDRFPFVIHLEPVGADLSAQPAADAEVLIDLSHEILLLS